MEMVTVNNQGIKIKEYKGQRVITLKEIDLVHCRINGTARRNFNQNKKYFVENEDYFFLKPENSECTKFVQCNIPAKGITLITETGYLMLVKSLNDNLAWKVQKELIKGYFRAREKEKFTVFNPKLYLPISATDEWDAMKKMNEELVELRKDIFNKMKKVNCSIIELSTKVQKALDMADGIEFAMNRIEEEKTTALIEK